ncbi:MAG: DUF4384 domain-containing protein [Prevotellaceae bacterium]|jgi:hypothetical protein|nr:DUF4384 domain-containing protein [Prevotellaceae bacterium]
MKNAISMLPMLLLLTAVFPARLLARKPVKVCGEYTYCAPENVSLEQARLFVLQQAKLAALAERFGTIISRIASTTMENDGKGRSELSVAVYGGSDVKGEWLKDIKVEYDKPYYENDMLVLRVSVCGTAREIVGARVDFSAKILRNGTDNKYESDSGSFRHGDDIYLSFRSPVDAFLAVYLLDNTSHTAFCLLPYKGDPRGRARVEAGRDYVFFSKEHADPDEKPIVNEYKMTCSKSPEHNAMYFIVSTCEFTKANDMDLKDTLPRELPSADFHEWLLKNRRNDRNMKVEMRSITIKK